MDRSPPSARRVRWHRMELCVLTALGTACIVGTFLPWLRAGSTARSSYDLLGLLDRLHLAPGGPVELLVRWWPIVPLLVVVALLLTWCHRLTFAIVAAAIAAVYIGGASVGLLVGARDTEIRLGVGPLVCSVASALFLVDAIVLQMSGRALDTSWSGGSRPGIGAEHMPPVPSPHADPQ